MGSQSFFEAAFGVGAAAYVVAFAGCVYLCTSSAQAKLGVSLLACALPALLATELSGGDVVKGDELAGTWLQEVVGTAVMVACTCSPGALVGHLGAAYEYACHFAMMMLADYSCGGPHVNPLVTTTQCVAKDEQTWTDGASRVLAQLGGGVVGWRLLLAAGAYMPGEVGGPAPDARLPLYYVFLSECLGGAALCGAVWAFATTKVGDVYVRKMALINCTLRTVILCFSATGPAVNPALAFSWVFATEGAWPTFEGAYPSYVAYWFGGLTGAVAMGLIWRFVNKPAASETTKVTLGVVCIASCVAAWAFVLSVEAQVIADDADYAAAMDARHPITKLLKRKPKAYRA